MADLFTISLIIYMINIPFGYWRAGTKRFSLQWYLAIHMPVPAIVFLRVYLNLGWTWQTYAFFILAFFLGQLTGKMLRRIFRKV